VVYLISRIQATEQFIGLADSDEIAPARGFHRCNGFGIRIERLERQGFFRGNTDKQETKGVGHGKPDFLQRSGGFLLVRSSMLARTTTFPAMAATLSELHCSQCASNSFCCRLLDFDTLLNHAIRTPIFRPSSSATNRIPLMVYFPFR